MANENEKNEKDQRDITIDPQPTNTNDVPDVEKKSPGDDVPEAPPEAEKGDREAGLQPIYEKNEK